jgi:hypothetical protein
VSAEAERLKALDLIVDHLVPGRSVTLRPHTRKELAATQVVALSLREASVNARTGDPVDEDADVHAGVWAGILPLSVVAGPVTTASDCPADAEIPPEVVDRARAWEAPEAP